MNKKILLIIGEHNFATIALKNNLIAGGFEVIEVEAVAEEVERHKNDADIYLYYLGPYFKNMIRVLEVINEINSDFRKTLCLIGESIGLRIVKEELPDLVIREQYTRPLDIRQVVLDMNEFANDHYVLTQLKTILLVDDDTDFLKMMQNWLRNDYWIDVASSGDQALEYLTDNRPDLILLDYEMPGQSGADVMKIIRDRPMTSRIPIIFLTGKNDQDVVMEILNQKPEGYILKSSDRDDVLDKLKQFFTKHILLRKRDF